jgi:hypothetical protein
MDIFLDILQDSVLDTLKLIPFLFLTYLAMEALEHKAGDRSRAAVERAGHAGPVVGALLGVLPQCGFSAAASTLYAGRVVTLGTLLAVFLSTSDEMLPIFIAEQVNPLLIVQIIAIKAAIGMIMGFAIDGILHARRRVSDEGMRIHDLCEQDHCGCDEEGEGVFKSALHHTLQVTLFIFLITFALAALIAVVGEDALGAFISANPTLSVFASALVGLIPNCGASVVLTELYLDGALGFGEMMAGLLVSAGIGLLVLLRTNRHAKQNVTIVAILFLIGAAWGLFFQAIGFSL